MRPIFTISLLLVGLLTAADASAQTNGFAAVDANGDGVIGRQEALTAQDRAFDRLDRNGDGRLVVDELASGSASSDARMTRTRARRGLSNLDGDDSGDVSRAEYQAAMTPYFDLLDVNGDGALEAAELQRAIEPEARRE